MKYKFKVDRNVYNSETFPFALYEWKGSSLWGQWHHIESHKTKADAIAHYERIKDYDIGMPMYLEGI